MAFEQWINCRLGFDISIPGFVARRDGGREASGFGNAAFWTTTPTYNVQCDQVDGARYLLPPGYPVSVITEIPRTIERRLIRTLHLGERSILKFRIGNLSRAKDERPTCSRSDIQLLTMRVPRLSTEACRRDERPRPPALRDTAYRDAPYLRALKSC